MANVGDKYIIEIGDVPYMKNEKKLWNATLFNSLVFDENGLNKLKNYNEECDGVQRINDADREYHYQKGLNDAWEAARKISNMEYKESVAIFGDRYIEDEFWKHYSAAEAISKIKVYEEQKKTEEESIKIGDEVIRRNMKGIAVRDTYYVGSDKEPFTLIWFGTSVSSCSLKNVTKTGRHFDIEGILKAMREETN